MPEIITRNTGISFSAKEIETMLGETLDFCDTLDFEKVFQFVIKAHENNEFEEFGFTYASHVIVKAFVDYDYFEVFFVDNV